LTESEAINKAEKVMKRKKEKINLNLSLLEAEK
jgi:hypothetical protein